MTDCSYSGSEDSSGFGFNARQGDEDDDFEASSYGGDSFIDESIEELSVSSNDCADKVAAALPPDSNKQGDSDTASAAPVASEAQARQDSQEEDDFESSWDAGSADDIDLGLGDAATASRQPNATADTSSASELNKDDRIMEKLAEFENSRAGELSAAKAKGQATRCRRAEVAACEAEARAAEAATAGDWDTSIAAYEEALQILPADAEDVLRSRIKDALHSAQASRAREETPPTTSKDSASAAELVVTASVDDRSLGSSCELSELAECSVAEKPGLASTPQGASCGEPFENMSASGVDLQDAANDLSRQAEVRESSAQDECESLNSDQESANTAGELVAASVTSAAPEAEVNNASSVCTTPSNTTSKDPLGGMSDDCLNAKKCLQTEALPSTAKCSAVAEGQVANGPPQTNTATETSQIDGGATKPQAQAQSAGKAAKMTLADEAKTSPNRVEHETEAVIEKSVPQCAPDTTVLQHNSMLRQSVGGAQTDDLALDQQTPAENAAVESSPDTAESNELGGSGNGRRWGVVFAPHKIILEYATPEQQLRIRCLRLEGLSESHSPHTVAAALINSLPNLVNASQSGLISQLERLVRKLQRGLKDVSSQGVVDGPDQLDLGTDRTSPGVYEEDFELSDISAADASSLISPCPATPTQQEIISRRKIHIGEAGQTPKEILEMSLTPNSERRER